MSYFTSRGWRWEYQLIEMKYNIMYIYTKGGGGNSYGNAMIKCAWVEVRLSVD